MTERAHLNLQRKPLRGGAWPLRRRRSCRHLSDEGPRPRGQRPHPHGPRPLRGRPVRRERSGDFQGHRPHGHGGPDERGRCSCRPVAPTGAAAPCGAAAASPERRERGVHPLRLPSDRLAALRPLLPLLHCFEERLERRPLLLQLLGGEAGEVEEEAGAEVGVVFAVELGDGTLGAEARSVRPVLSCQVEGLLRERL